MCMQLYVTHYRFRLLIKEAGWPIKLEIRYTLNSDMIFKPISYYLVKQKLAFNFIYFSIALCRPPLLGRPLESKIWPQIPSLFSC